MHHKYSKNKIEFIYFSGDVLAIEKPFAGVLRKESFGHNCHYCFKRCLSGIPCINCNLVRMYSWTMSTFLYK